MAFQATAAKLPGKLVEIDSESDPAVAIMDNEDLLEFPPGIKFSVNNHYDDATKKLVQVRVQAQGPAKNGVLPPPILIPRFCSEDYVKEVIKRLTLGV